VAKGRDVVVAEVVEKGKMQRRPARTASAPSSHATNVAARATKPIYAPRRELNTLQMRKTKRKKRKLAPSKLKLELQQVKMVGTSRLPSLRGNLLTSTAAKLLHSMLSHLVWRIQLP
jgi:hypothetical protein